MEKKTKHIRIRITESQFRWLADVLITEQRSKSNILRDALNRYLVENIRKDKINTKNENNDSTHDKSRKS